MEAFVYRWRNLDNRTWYIGYHKGSAGDGYICSSQTARPEIEQNPGSWQRKILRWGSKKEMIKLEHRILKKLQAAQNPRSLNRSQGYPIAPQNPGRKAGKKNSHRRRQEITIRFRQAILERTGKSYETLLFEDYLTAVVSQDKKIINAYHQMFLKSWGQTWFDRLRIMDTLTESKSKKPVRL